MPYFAESTPPRRWLQALAVIVAGGMVYLGVAGYREREQARRAIPIVPAPVVTTVQPTLPKKSSAKAGRTRNYETKQPAFTAGFKEGAIEPLSMRETLSSNAENSAGNSDPDNTIGSQPPSHEEGKYNPSLHACAPLPNSTRPEDVDAPYYQNWASEYGCKPAERPQR